MDSSSPCSPQEVRKLLHKWATDSQKIEAVFVSVRSGVHLFASGVVTELPAGFAITEQDSNGRDKIAFDPTQASVCRLADDTALRGHPLVSRFLPARTFLSGIVFEFKQVEVLVLLAVSSSMVH